MGTLEHIQSRVMGLGDDDDEPGINTMRFNSFLTQQDEDAMRDAATFGDLEELRRLTGRQGVRVDARDQDGLQAIHRACEQGHLEVTKFLIDSCGCDAQAEAPSGRMPLHYAVAR